MLRSNQDYTKTTATLTTLMLRFDIQRKEDFVVDLSFDDMLKQVEEMFSDCWMSLTMKKDFQDAKTKYKKNYRKYKRQLKKYSKQIEAGMNADQPSPPDPKPKDPMSSA